MVRRMPEVPRRRFLGRLGTLAGAAGLSAAAGCLSGAGTAQPAYTDWLAAPGDFGGRRYAFERHDVAGIRAQRAAFDPAAYGAYRRWAADGYDHFGLPFGAVEEELLGVNRRLTLLRGDWDRATLREHLTATGYVEADPHAGFDLYRHRMAELAVAVDDDRLLRSRRTARSPLGTARLFLDVGAGQRRRYVDADTVAAELARRLGTATYVLGVPHPRRERTDPDRGRFRRAESRGLARTVDGATTTDRVVVTFPDETDAENAVGAVETWTERTGFFEGVSATVGVEGRSAVATVQRPTDTLAAVAPLL